MNQAVSLYRKLGGGLSLAFVARLALIGAADVKFNRISGLPRNPRDPSNLDPRTDPISLGIIV